MAEKKNEDVLETMRAALLRCKSKWTLLSKQTERELSYRWIVGFANGEIRDPAFSKIMTLGKFLGMNVEIRPGRHYLQFKPE